MRSILLTFILSFTFGFTWSQRNGDVGIYSGISYYMGDINMTKHLYKPSPAFGAMYRHNFNPRNAIRFHTLYSSIRGDDMDFDNDLQQSRGMSFNTSFLDIALNTEFNFLEYRPTKRNDNYSPYMTGGIGYNLVFSPEARGVTSLVLTWGAGFKLNVSRRVSAGIEWTFRKTFNDRLDGIENHGPEYTTFYHNNDWYSIVGIFVTYKFLRYLSECPAYDQINNY